MKSYRHPKIYSSLIGRSFKIYFQNILPMIKVEFVYLSQQGNNITRQDLKRSRILQVNPMYSYECVELSEKRLEYFVLVILTHNFTNGL